MDEWTSGRVGEWTSDGGVEGTRSIPIQYARRSTQSGILLVFVIAATAVLARRRRRRTGETMVVARSTDVVFSGFAGLQLLSSA